jgi:hypothetical protein
MSLRDQLAPDLANVFINESEWATVREFRIKNADGSFKVFSAKCVWDKEAAKKHPLVTIHGYYVGDVICYIESYHFPRMPIAGELLYSPANQPYEVIICTDEEFCYAIGLSSTRSQPAKYGSN